MASIFAGYNTVNVYAYYGLNSILNGRNRRGKDKHEGINTLFFMSYSHKYNKSICGMLLKEPLINSIEVHH
jgi:hypothetical protein